MDFLWQWRGCVIEAPGLGAAQFRTLLTRRVETEAWSLSPTRRHSPDSQRQRVEAILWPAYNRYWWPSYPDAIDNLKSPPGVQHVASWSEGPMGCPEAAALHDDPGGGGGRTAGAKW